MLVNQALGKMTERRSVSFINQLFVVVVSITLLAINLPNIVGATQFSSTAPRHTFVSSSSTIRRRRRCSQTLDPLLLRRGGASSSGGVDTTVEADGIRNNHNRQLLENTSNDRRVTQARKSHLNTVAWVAFANFLVYTFRPDKSIVWQVSVYSANL